MINKIHLFALLSILLAFSLAFSINAGELAIHHISVGQGDCILIVGPDSTTLLFDGGRNGLGNSEVVPYLTSLGISELNYMIASHYDADHIGGLDEIIESGIDVIDVIYDRGGSGTTQTYYDYVDATETTTAGGRTTITSGFVIDLGDSAKATCVIVNGYFFNGDSISIDDENDMCVGLLIEYGTFDFIATGDLGGGGGTTQDVETPLSQALRNPIGGLLGSEGVDVFHLNHHGSANSTNLTYVNFLNPEIGTINVGGNAYGHPTQTAINNCFYYNVIVYQTDEGDTSNANCSTDGIVAGDIVIRTDGITNYTLSGNGYEFTGTETYELDIPDTTQIQEAKVLITEVFYDTPGTDSEEEWIELYNQDTLSVDISGWSITDNNDIGITYHLPTDVIIQPQSHFVIAANSIGFYALYGFDADVDATGDLGGLSNTGDAIYLYNNFNEIIDIVAWEGGHSTGGLPDAWGSDSEPYASTGNSIARADSIIDTDTYADWLSQQTPNPQVQPEVSIPYEDEKPIIPDNIYLMQNYPNPFNPETIIKYKIDTSEHIILNIYNLNGQLVRILEEAHKEAGFYTIIWNGEDNQGKTLPSGIYIYKLILGNGKQYQKKMVYLK